MNKRDKDANRTYMEDENANPKCPDHTSHWQNAHDILFGGRELQTISESDAVDELAEYEYQECEGH